MLVDPPINGDEARIRAQTLGADKTAGERRQVFVPANSVMWCELPQADLTEADQEHVGCFYNSISIG